MERVEKAVAEAAAGGGRVGGERMRGEVEVSLSGSLSGLMLG